MGLSGPSDRNEQTANKDMDYSTLMLHTLSPVFSRKAKRVREGKKEGGQRQADRKRVGERHEREMRR